MCAAEVLIDGDKLESVLGHEDLRLYDCTTWLVPDPPNIYRVESGRESYETGHIVGANFLDFTNELSDPNSDLNFMMPPAEKLGDVLGRQGIGDKSNVVLYSRENVQWATRVWWMLRGIGFDNASVLDGGFDKWEKEGRPITTAIKPYQAEVLTPRPRLGLFCNSGTVLDAKEEVNTCVINALRESLHNGTESVNYGRPGRIPGSVNIPGISLIDPDTKAYLPLEKLKEIFSKVGAIDAEKVVIYCGGGIAATSDAFTLLRLGQDNVTVYDASMSEWANDPSLPMETG